MATNKSKVIFQSQYDKKGAVAASKSVKGFTTQTKKADTSMKSFIKSGIGVAAIGVAIKKVIQFMGQMTDAWKVQEGAEIKLQAVLTATGNVLQTSLREFKDMATELSRLTSIEDEVILKSQGLFATFKQIGKDVFPDAIEAAANMSVIMGQDLTQASIQLGIALNDPIQGVSRLKRVGVVLSDAQKESIKEFVALNDIASAQGVILDELAGEFGGVARAMGESAAGNAKRLANAFGDLMEAGGKLLDEFLRPIQKGLTDYLEHAVDVIDMYGQLTAANEAFLAGTATAEQKVLLFNDAIEKQVEVLDGTREAAQELNRAQKGLSVGLIEQIRVEENLLSVLILERDAIQAVIDKENAQKEAVAALSREYLNLLSVADKSIDAFSDPLEQKLEGILQDIETLSNFSGEIALSEDELLQIEKALNLLNAERLSILEQIAEKGKEVVEDERLFTRLLKSAREELALQNEAATTLDAVKSEMVGSTGKELALYQMIQAELESILGLDVEIEESKKQQSVYEKAIAEFNQDQAETAALNEALQTAHLELSRAIQSVDIDKINLNGAIIQQLQEKLGIEKDSLDIVTEEALTIEQLMADTEEQLKNRANLAGILAEVQDAIQTETIQNDEQQLAIFTEMENTLNNMLGIRESIEAEAKEELETISRIQQLRLNAVNQVADLNEAQKEYNKLIVILEKHSKTANLFWQEGLNQSDIDALELYLEALEKILGIQEEQTAAVETTISKYDQLLNEEKTRIDNAKELLRIQNSITAQLQFDKTLTAEQAEILQGILNNISDSESVVSTVSTEPTEAEASQLESALAGSDVGNFINTLKEGGDVLEFFIDLILQSALKMESLQNVLNFVSNALDQVFKLLDPFIGAVLMPLIIVFNILLKMIGDFLLPVLVPLIPIFQVFAQILGSAIIPSLQVLGVLFDIVGIVLSVLVPIIKAVGIIFEILISPVKWLGDLFGWLGEQMRIFIWNLQHPLNRQEFTQFSSDAFTGLAARIDAIANAGAVGSLADPFLNAGQDSFVLDDVTAPGNQIGGISGGNVTVQQPAPIYITLNVNNIVGTDGLLQAGEVIVMALQEYAGRGGDVSFLEA